MTDRAQVILMSWISAIIAYLIGVIIVGKNAPQGIYWAMGQGCLAFAAVIAIIIFIIMRK